ncbi:hypothetical protein HII31_02096, partial [Pseudocercospora fuligena]
MVRIKHRYLLMNVLYPQDASSAKHNDENLPWSVKFRRPSSDRFEAGFIVRLVRNGVAELFGDYGAGMVSGSLKILRSYASRELITGWSGRHSPLSPSCPNQLINLV